MKLILRKREYADLFLASLQHNTLIGLHWRVAVICCCLLRRHLRDKLSLCLGAIYWLVSALLFVFCLVAVSSSSSLDYTFPHFPLLIITEKLELLIKMNN